MITLLAAIIGGRTGYKLAEYALQKTQAKKAGKRIEA